MRDVMANARSKQTKKIEMAKLLCPKQLRLSAKWLVTSLRTNTFCAHLSVANQMNKYYTIFYVLLFSFSIPSIYLFLQSIDSSRNIRTFRDWLGTVAPTNRHSANRVIISLSTSIAAHLVRTARNGEHSVANENWKKNNELWFWFWFNSLFDIILFGASLPLGAYLFSPL